MAVSSDDQIKAVRAFATTTEQAAAILRCSYADAATFLMKLGPFVATLQDRDFREKLDRYCQALTQKAVESLPTGVIH